ncbi:hypothetical protein GF389_04965 [Candidatus Dojkabacteria bacterium]|nr:hypothetical protein [Candidatus Dojkabacteria bacterium]
MEAAFRDILTKQAKKITKLAVKRPVFTLKLSIILLGLVFIAIGIVANKVNEVETLESEAVLGASREKPLGEFKEISRPTFTVQSIVVAEEKKEAEQARLEAIRKAQEERAKHTDRINAFLNKQNSPVANTKITDILYDQYKSKGTDYKILLAIMGVESGFCNASFHYNCFGYLNGAKYSSYENAFNDLVPKISSQYADKYGTDFVSLAKAYGIVNWKAGAANLEGYYNSI